MLTDILHMQEALAEARKAFDHGEIPIGAVLIQGETIIARDHNTREGSKNPLHHAEMRILEEAGNMLGNWRLEKVSLYVTVEPCPMCLGALLQARVGRLIYGCTDPKRPSIEAATIRNEIYQLPSLGMIRFLKGNNHTLEISGSVLENECAQLLKDFFKKRR